MNNLQRVLTLSICTCMALVLLADSALAQKRSALKGQPAVRHKLELRKGRFEFTPTFDTSVASNYKSTLSLGVKLDYHISDLLSIGGLVFLGSSSNTGLAGQIRDSLQTMPDNTPAPTQGQFDSAINETPIHGGVGITFTPLFGKVALFGKTFVNFDIYFRGGLGFGQTKNAYVENGPCVAMGDGPVLDVDGNPVNPPQELFDDPRNDCPDNEGTNLGLMVGGGMHFFFNKWIALDLSVHNYIYSDNPRGGDFDGDGRIDGDDRQFLGHLFFGIGVAFYLPTDAPRSN